VIALRFVATFCLAQDAQRMETMPCRATFATRPSFGCSPLAAAVSFSAKATAPDADTTLRVSSVAAKRFHWVDARGPARGDVTRGKRRSNNQQHADADGLGIEHSHEDHL
jgi:hypothetical protein